MSRKIFYNNRIHKIKNSGYCFKKKKKNHKFEFCLNAVKNTKKTMRVDGQNERCTLNKNHSVQSVINVLQVGVYATNLLYVHACVRSGSFFAVIKHNIIPNRIPVVKTSRLKKNK